MPGSNRLFYVFLIFFSPALLYSQNDLLSFRVLDEKTKAPIQFCYVIIKGQNVSSQSDENGNVRINATVKDTLVIYQLGYFLRNVNMNEITENKGIAFLTSKLLTLEEVIIRSSVVDTFQNKNNTVFLDFDFYDDNILSLVNKGKLLNSLMLVDENGNKVHEMSLKIKAESLFKDCFGNIHLLTSDSIYQVYYNYRDLTLLKPFPINKFHELLKPCECFYRNKYVFKARHYKGLKNTYCLYDDRYQGQKEIIGCVADSQAIKGFNLDYDVSYFLSERRKGNAYATSVTEISNHIDQYREELTLPADYANLLRPVESEIKRLDTNFVIFDYTNKVAYRLSLKGQLQNKFTLKNFTDISPKLYIDYDVHEYIFSSITKNGVLTLFRYDPIKNTFTHKFVLKDYHFIKKFKIKGNNLYFINKDRSSNDTKTKIVKASIDWQPS